MELFEPRLDTWIAAHRDAIVAHAMDLIRIPSVSKYSPHEAHPFGDGCAEALDYMLNLAAALGFSTCNYDYYSGSVRFAGKTDRTIGIFVHLDTVTATDTWSFQPFSPTVRNGWLYGIGAQDNKGAAVTMLYLLRCLADLGVLLEHSILLVFGCGKKAEMQDIDHFLSYEPAPVLSLVADSFFPVELGEKGSMDAELTCTLGGSKLLDLRAGHAANMVPDYAFALFEGFAYADIAARLQHDSRCSVIPVDRFVKIATGGPGGHAAFPENTPSPVSLLADILLKNGICDAICVPALTFLRDAYQTCLGAPLGVDLRDEVFGYTTHVCGMVRMRAGLLRQIINVRYVASATSQEVQQRLANTAAAAGFDFRPISNTNPSVLDPKLRPLAAALTSITNRVLGTKLRNFTTGGVTYVKKLPTAIAFGVNRSDIPSPFGAGRGGGHLADEAVQIQSLMDGLKIYALSLLRIDTLL